MVAGRKPQLEAGAPFSALLPFHQATKEPLRSCDPEMGVTVRLGTITHAELQAWVSEARQLEALRLLAFSTAMHCSSELCPATQPQFGEYAVQVALHRGYGHEQALRDLGV